MNSNIQTEELILVTINCLIWLAPLALSVKRKTISLIHPSSMIPIFVVISLFTTMSENWFGWLRFNDSGVYGLRITTIYNLSVFPDLYIYPMIILLFSGITYFMGVKLGCQRVIANEKDRFHLVNKFQTLDTNKTTQLFINSSLFAILSITPFLMFGQGQGFFWAAALFYVINFLPVLLMNQSFILGTIFTFLGLVFVGSRGSKGDYIYYLLPLIVFNHGFTTLMNNNKKYFYRMIIVLLLITVTLWGTSKILSRMGINQDEIPFVNSLLTREYGFETFSNMVYSKEFLKVGYSNSWLFGEIVDSLPSFLGVLKKNMGHLVAELFLPLDFAKLPSAGFHRFFLFPFYLDFGFFGAILGSFTIGFTVAKIYSFALSKAITTNSLGPLLTYLPLPVYSELIVNGVFSYFFIHTLLAVLMISLILFLSNLTLRSHRF